MADPTFDPNRPYSYGHPQTTSQTPQFDPKKTYRYAGQDDAPSTDPFIAQLQGSPAEQFAAGVTQGMVLDPVEKAGELTGVGQNPPKWLEDRLQATRQASGKGLGQAGHVVGSVADPLMWLLPELKAGEYAAPGLRALAKLATGIYRGAVGGATQPTGAKNPAEAAKQTVPQLLQGGAVGGALGAPGATAAALSYKGVQPMIRETMRDLPVIWRMQRLRNLGIPSFTRWWHSHSLEPIGGRVPGVASKEAMDNVGGQIGKAIDDSTRNMTFDLGTPAVTRNLATTLGTSRLNLAIGGGNALDKFNELIESTVHQPLRFTGGKLSSTELQRISSNLDAHTRQIVPSTPDAVALKRELENYRMTLLDNASGTPAEKQAYAKAREAWRRHATGRDSQPPGEPSGFIDPDHVASELSRRDPLRYPSGGGPRGQPSPTQRAVNQAQEATASMVGAARRGVRGRPPPQPESGAAAAGAAASDIRPPISYAWPSQ